MTLDEYSLDRGNDLHSCGGDVRSHRTDDLAGRLMIIEAVIAFGREEAGILELTEVVELRGDGSAHRRRYRYHFSHDGLFLFRYDRDPKNHPDMVEHKHVGVEANRIPSGPVRLSDVLEEVYDRIAEIEFGEG